MARIVAGILAATAAFGVGLALVLRIARAIEGEATIGEELWRFFWFYTNISNILVIVVAGAVALAPGSVLAGARARLVMTSAILITGFVYAVALRATDAAAGLSLFTSHLRHDVTPVLAAILVLFPSPRPLGWSDVWWVLLVPVLYASYVVARAEVDGQYPYWFLNLDELGPAAFAKNVVLLGAGFVVAAAVVVAADKTLTRLRQRPARA